MLDAADLAIIESHDEVLTHIERTLLEEVRRLQQEIEDLRADHAEEISQLEVRHEEELDDAREEGREEGRQESP